MEDKGRVRLKIKRDRKVIEKRYFKQKERIND